MQKWALRHSRSIVGAAVVIALQFPAPATADDARNAANAEALIAEGVALRQVGKDAEALAVFRRAYEMTKTARARAQMGLAEQALGIWLRAEEDLVGALAQTADPWVAQYREPLENALVVVRGRLGSLDIVSNVGADVSVDGAKVGSAPGRIFRVEAGTRSVRLEAPGYYPITRNVVVAGGAVARETFELSREPPAPAGGAGGAGDRQIAPPDGRGQRTTGWILVGVGAAGIATGVVGLIARSSAYSAYNDDPTCPGERALQQPPACDDRISSGKMWQTVSILGFATGGAIAIAGTVLVLTAAPSPPSVSAAACAPGLGSVSCWLRF